MLLFCAAFGAATLLPLQSEAVLVSVLLQDDYPVYIVILMASLGNVLGSCINWYLGLKIEQFKDKTWFPVSAQNMLKAQKNLSKIWLLVIILELATDYW